MSDVEAEGDPTTPIEATHPEEPKPHSFGGTLIFVAVILLLTVIVAGILAVDLWNSSEGDLVAVDSTPAPSTSQPSTSAPATTAPATTAAPSTAPPTTAPSSPPPSAATTAPATTPPAGVVEEAVWPLPSSDVRYGDPVEAARGFAVEFVGFTEPLVGEFAAGDSRSGEIEVRRTESGPVTTVLLRQLADDDSWWVIGSASENIRVEQPAAFDTVTSPMGLTGEARAFEGTVDFELRADGAPEPLVTGFLTGGAGPEFAPFDESLEFSVPGVVGGALVLSIPSADDGSVQEATVIRVFFPGG